MEEASKKRVFSGIQPTGGFTLGNYLGALKNWKNIQDEYECVYSVVDLHALTVRNDPATLRRQIREACAMLLALGIDPHKSILFVQSHVSAHAELSWLLSCYTQFGELSRMTQFKDKSQKHPDNINAGLFTYPVLMAADILLYDTDVVPVGADQKQHVELTRDVAIRFNGLYGDTFRVPEPLFTRVAARVMSLQDPAAKMSKSDPNENARIMLSDSSEAIVRKIKRAVTDSGSEVCRGEGKQGVENLMSIYGGVTGRSFEEIEEEFRGRGYGDFKAAVADAVVAELQPLQQEYQRILSDRGYLDGVLKEGSERASSIARKVLSRAQKRIGINIFR